MKELKIAGFNENFSGNWFKTVYEDEEDEFYLKAVVEEGKEEFSLYFYWMNGTSSKFIGMTKCRPNDLNERSNELISQGFDYFMKRVEKLAPFKMTGV